VLRIFYRPQKSIALAGFEPATFGSSGKHTNHYTTEATMVHPYSSFFLLVFVFELYFNSFVVKDARGTDLNS
jgi:hypothetical protein